MLKQSLAESSLKGLVYLSVGLVLQYQVYVSPIDFHSYFLQSVGSTIGRYAQLQFQMLIG
jgi:hypothetical protein